MEVPFFDLKRLYKDQKSEIDAAVLEALESGWYILGGRLSRFEEKMKAFLCPDSSSGGGFVGCNSGTDALVLSLLAAGIGVGDEVVTVSHTAIPTITAIRSVGATPVFVDIHPETWLMDVAEIEGSISPKTKAVICVHLYGNTVNVEGIKTKLVSLGREDIAIIEDVAQAQGALLPSGEQAGTVGRFGAFSFYPTKNLGAFGDGGGVFAKDTSDVERLRVLRNYGQKDRYNATVARGINSRLDEIQAAVLETRLKRFDGQNVRRRQIMSQYRDGLAGLPLKFQKVTDGCVPAWHLCVVELENTGVKEKLQAFLTSKGIQTLIHYPIPTHKQVAFSSERFCKLKFTEDLVNRILSLPMNSFLNEQELEQIVANLRVFFE